MEKWGHAYRSHPKKKEATTLFNGNCIFITKIYGGSDGKLFVHPQAKM
mgnify:CR=1 FL=1